MDLSVNASPLIILDFGGGGGGQKGTGKKKEASFTIILHVRHLASTAGGKR